MTGDAVINNYGISTLSNSNTNVKNTIKDYLSSFVKNNILEVEHIEYSYIRIIPTSSIRNRNTNRIVDCLTILYRSFWDRFVPERHSFKRYYKLNPNIYFMIYMDCDEDNEKHAYFYFAIPSEYLTMFKSSIIDSWENNITIEDVDSLPNFSISSDMFTLDYKLEDAMSLACDRRDNDLLSSILNNFNIIQEGDKLGVIYKFEPFDQLSWCHKYDNTIEKKKYLKPIEKNKFDAWFITKSIFLFLSKVIDILFDSLTSNKHKEQKVNVKDLKLKESTKDKRDTTVIKTGILCISQSNDAKRQESNGRILCNSFRTIDDDNLLVCTRYKCTVNTLNYISYKIPTFITSTKEDTNFLALPAKELLETYPFINSINVKENPVPKHLQSGYIKLGTTVYKNTTVEAFMEDHKNIGNLTQLLIAPQHGGKSTYMANYVAWCHSRNEGCLIFDYIKKNEFTDAVLDLINKGLLDKNKVIVLDMSDTKNLQGIGYNEILPKSNSVEDIVECANRKAKLIADLIDAVSEDGEELKNAMSDFIINIANITFAVKPNASLKDVINMLTDYELRNSVINDMSFALKQELEDDIRTVNQLNKKDKNGDIVGNSTSTTVEGILHRVSKLKNDYRLKKMYNMDCSHNIDLAKELREGKVIIVKMPQEIFSDEVAKNVICTYMFTKLWVATLINGALFDNPNRTHFICDEPFQVRTMIKLIKERKVMPQFRKFFMKCLFSIQGIEQISEIHETLLNAGASYMFLHGTTKKTYNEFKEELAPYTFEHLQHLPPWHSLNYIYTSQGKFKFVTELPKPVVRVQK